MKKFLGLGLVLLLVGCGAGTSKDGKINLSLATWGSSPEETALVERQIAEFEKQNPNIKVTKEVVTGDYNQVLQTNFAAGTEADVFYLDVVVASTFIEKGAILPLNDYLSPDDVNDFNKNLLDGFSQDGKIYGLPKDYNPLVLAVNTEMLEKSGVEIPTDWAELKAALKKIDEAGKAGKLGASYMKPMSSVSPGERIAPYILQNNGDVYDNEKGKAVFNSPEAVEGLNYYYDLIKEGYVREPKSLGEAWNGDTFAREKVAMVVEGGWIIPYLATAAPNLKYEIADLPKGKRNATMLFTVSYSMGRNTKHPKESAELIKFLTGKQAQGLMVETGLGLPTRESLNEEFARIHPTKKALVEMAKVGRPYNFGTNGLKVASELGKANEKIYIDYVNGNYNIDIQKILDDSAEKANQ